MFDQSENLRNAILKKRARVEAIDQIIRRPLPKGGSIGRRQRLIEQKLHLEKAIHELQTALQAHERSMQNRIFGWNDFDSRLISQKVLELAEEMHERIKKAQNRILFECARNGNSASYLHELLEFHERLTDEWAVRLYASYCEAWVEQNQSISPSFILAVRDRPIRVFFSVRTSTVETQIRGRARATNERASPLLLRNWHLHMGRLANRWHNRLQTEAAKCEYCIARGVSYAVPAFGASAPLAPKGDNEHEPLPESRSRDVERSSRTKTGRRAKFTNDFVSFAGSLWLEAKTCEGAQVSEKRLAQIAAELDAKGYVPPAEYLEGRYAEDLKAFNSRNSNSKVGPVKTWVQLAFLADKDHVRGMRRLLSRCAEKVACLIRCPETDSGQKFSSRQIR